MSPGPTYTTVHFHSFQKIPDSLHPASTEGRLWDACLADVAKDPAWYFTLCGQLQREGRKVVLVIGWKHDRQSEIPSWTSTPDASTQPPFTSLLGLLESPPQISNVAFRFPIAHVNLHPTVTPTDIFTFYIPVYVNDEQLATFNQVLRNFHSAFAHVSHEPSLEMLSAQSGWGLRVVDRGGKGVKMMVFVSLHTWTSKDNELAYKNGGEYERLFLKPLQEAEAFGVEWDEEQVVFERVGLWVPIVPHSGRRGILESLKGLAALTTRAFQRV